MAFFILKKVGAGALGINRTTVTGIKV